MKTIIASLLALFCILAQPNNGYAAAVPWVGVLTGNGGTISVPAGKILIFQTIGTPSFVGAIRTTITGTFTGGIGNGSFSAPLTFVSQGEGLSFLENPVRLGPGMTITNGSSHPVTIHGVAMDIGDFFAAVSPVIRGLSGDSGQLAAVVDSRTTVPTTTSGEVSTDLQTWTKSGVTVARSQSNPRITKISTAMNTARKFLRAISTRKAVAAN